jgi:hypothetical protein
LTRNISVHFSRALFSAVATLKTGTPSVTAQQLANMSTLRLDSDIRNWVLIPITVAMFFVGIVRHNIGKLMHRDRKVDLKALREAQAVIRAERLRNNSGYLQSPGFRMRKHFFCAPVSDRSTPRVLIEVDQPPRQHPTSRDVLASPPDVNLNLTIATSHPIRRQSQETGVFNQTAKKANPQAQMLSDPTMMTSMLTKNLNFIVPNMLTAGWVNFFFTGFVVGKVPFPLTQRFRGMLQRGIELQSLDVTYVSSLSWYFLNFFGLRGVFNLCLGENTLDDTQAMQQQMAMGMNTEKAFAAVKENLDMMEHEFVLYVAERRAERLLRRLVSGAAVGEARAFANAEF